MAEPTTLNDLPSVMEGTSTQPLTSASEMRFLLNRLTDEFDFDPQTGDGSLTEVFQCLLYKRAAERADIRIDSEENLVRLVDDLERSAAEEFPLLQDIEITPPTLPLVRATLRLFSDSFLNESLPEVTTGLTDWFSMWNRKVKPQTAPDRAETLVRLANLAARKAAPDTGGE